MTSQQLEALKEWVQAEIEAGLESIEEDEAGYRGCSNHEKQNANSCFEKLSRMMLLH